MFSKNVGSKTKTQANRYGVLVILSALLFPIGASAQTNIKGVEVTYIRTDNAEQKKDGIPDLVYLNCGGSKDYKIKNSDFDRYNVRGACLKDRVAAEESARDACLAIMQSTLNNLLPEVQCQQTCHVGPACSPLAPPDLRQDDRIDYSTETYSYPGDGDDDGCDGYQFKASCKRSDRWLGLADTLSVTVGCTPCAAATTGTYFE